MIRRFSLFVLGMIFIVPAMAQEAGPSSEKAKETAGTKKPTVPTLSQLPASNPAMGPLTPIDLPGALKLAGVENPQILIAQQRIVESAALRQLAAAQLLPNVNLGTNYNEHSGPLQSSTGGILNVDRSSLYLGAGTNVVGAGQVNIPGIVYNLNVSESIYKGLIARQGVERARYASLAVRNETLRRVAGSYLELLRAEGRRSLAFQSRKEAEEVARLTNAFAKAGQAALADADRTANELTRRNTDLVEAEAEVHYASARLAELLALDRTMLLHPVEEKIVPTPLVPDPIPLDQLLAIALLQRPELAEWQAAVRQAMLALDNAKLLPFSPNLIVGFSSGTNGGGSDLIDNAKPPTGLPANQPRFGNFGPRNDFDAVTYWTLQNLGLGNRALQNLAASRLSQAELEKLAVFNRVRREVAEAYVRSHTRFRQIGSAEQAVRTGEAAYREDFRRIQGDVGRPIELVESLRLLAQSRYRYLDAIVDYNLAHVDLYVALGQPPADVLARPVPTDFTNPLTQEKKRK